MTRIDDALDPRLAVYRGVRDRDLAREEGLFMVEGAACVRTLIEASRFACASVFVSEKRLHAVEGALRSLSGETPVYVAAQGVMNEVAGFDIHRGVLAAAHRGEEPPAGALVASAPRVATALALDDIGNHDNVGGLFRCAAAFGVALALSTRRTCDPLYRKSIRVSMGAALTVPFARVEDGASAVAALGGEGFCVLALTPTRGAMPLEEAQKEFAAQERVALVVGSEWEGVSPGAARAAAARVRIPISGAVDSLNVACAAAVALNALARPAPVR